MIRLIIMECFFDEKRHNVRLIEQSRNNRYVKKKSFWKILMISKIGAPRVGRGVARVEINSPLEFLIKRETNPSGSGTECTKGNGRCETEERIYGTIIGRADCERETVVRPVYEQDKSRPSTCCRKRFDDKFNFAELAGGTCKLPRNELCYIVLGVQLEFRRENRVMGAVGTG